MSPLVILNNGRSEYRRRPVTPPTDPVIDPEKAFYATITGSARLVQMQRRGVTITDQEIEDGIETNSEILGITPEEYKEKMQMITDPQPENNPTPNTDPEKFLESQILATAELINLQKNGLEIPNDEILKFKENGAKRLNISMEEYDKKLDMVLNPQPENNPNPEISIETSEPQK